VYRSLPLHSGKGRLIAEIDVIGVGAHGVDIFEVKCSNRVVKARKQLQKIKRLFGSGLDEQVNTWFYCGEAGRLLQII